MTPKLRPPFALLVSLVIIITLVATTAASAAKGGKKAAKSAPAPAKKNAKSAKAEKNSRNAKGREQAAKKSSKKETKAERRQRQREERAERGGKGGKLSKRERAAQARREAEERARRAEAARRAELARQAAIARQRALDEGLRNEVQENILRDDPTGEDPEVRRVAVAALGRAAGTVVVMNPKTGQIYTIVNQQWGVRRGFKPCSTTKLITGLAGLGEGVIDPIAENVSYGGQPTLTSALARSAPNSYFQQVGRRVGFERMVSYARQLGLGERTGVNHAGEYSGRLPLFKNDVGMLRMSSHGDDIEVTAVQLAALAGVFATGGTLLTPHLPRTPEENVKFRTEVRRQLNIPQENLRRMLVAMVGAVNYGSARKTYDPSQTIAGKTGTCIDTDREAWVGLFTSFAPVEDPQLAVAVITRGTDARKHLPVAIANQIYRTLSYRFGRLNGRPRFNLTPDLAAPRPVLTAPSIAEADDDVDEAEADAREELNGAPAPAAAPLVPASNANGSVRPVLMPIPQQRPATGTPAPAGSAPSQPMRNGAAGDDRPRRVPDNERQ
ncbi:MAG TPA: penicillin-binding transpeptidase domain-containing protein [Pyrinomonadaceae bacterium]|nr:penicillin-binding transpeptidase domain-containing protein [Pyrinomonadaceae bacterium]